MNEAKGGREREIRSEEIRFLKMKNMCLLGEGLRQSRRDQGYEICSRSILRRKAEISGCRLTPCREREEEGERKREGEGERKRERKMRDSDIIWR